MNFSKKTISAILFAALLAACGQSATDTASSKAVQTSQTAAISATAAPSDLLDSLAKAYPNGQMPAEKMAQAAKELAQNPAVLVLTDQAAVNSSQALSAPVQPQVVPWVTEAVYRIQNTTLTGAYFFTIYDHERDWALISNPNWKLEGLAFYASSRADLTLDPVHRFRNIVNGSYLYTIYEEEKANILANYANTFTYEGKAWYARKTSFRGWTPLYRFRNLMNGTYLYSAYEEEKTAILANYSAMFKLEGVAYYVQIPSTCVGSRCAWPERYGLVAKGVNTANEQIYYSETECVVDRWAGLTWQGQTPAGTGLRSNDQYKTNLDSTAGNQNMNTSGFPSPATQAQIDAVTNSIGFKNAVNASNLCGFSDWRMPTKSELESLLELAETPAIKNDWFPNTKPNFYWTSSPDVDVSAGYPTADSNAWAVSFLNPYRFAGLHSRNGQMNGISDEDKLLVRLVR